MKLIRPWKNGPQMSSVVSMDKLNISFIKNYWKLEG